MVICDICKKAFTSKIYLKKHFKWHMKKKPSDDEQYRQFIADNFDMNCDQCHVVFTTFHDARRHYKIEHNERKGYIKYVQIKMEINEEKKPNHFLHFFFFLGVVH